MPYNQMPDENGMMNRVPLPKDVDVQTAVWLLSEGNPGSIGVMSNFAHEADALELLHALDEMNLRGRQIFVAYNTASNQNMLTLTDHIRNRSQLMCDIVNDACINHSFKERASAGSSRVVSRS